MAGWLAGLEEGRLGGEGGWLGVREGGWVGGREGGCMAVWRGRVAGWGGRVAGLHEGQKGE